MQGSPSREGEDGGGAARAEALPSVADRSTEDLITLISLLRLNVEAVVSTNTKVWTAYDIPCGVEGNAECGGSLGL